MSIGTARWLAKKATRTGVAVGSLMTGSLIARQLIRRTPQVRALTYHRFGELRRDPFCIAEGVFDAQMRWIADNELAISIEDLAAFIAGRMQLPDGGVLVTIDDGYRSTFEIARRILKRHRIPAVAFVTAGLIGRHLPGDHEPFMSWEQVRGLLDAGLSVGSHAYTHSSFGQMNAEEAYAEGTRSRETLERELGRPVTAFAYPFGTAAHHSAVSARVLAEECGYRMLFLSEHGPIGGGSDPRLLKRVKIESGEPQWMFELACRGALDPWVFVDRGFRLRPAS